MRRLSAVPAVALVVLGAVACGTNAPPGSTPAPASALCSASYEPRELVVSGPWYSSPPTAPEGSRTTDAATIRKIAAAACALPEPPSDLLCTAEMGPSQELWFIDAQGRTTALAAAGFSCQFVEGLGTRRYRAKPLWEALAAAGLPSVPVR
ncbi:hypothetical protein PV458_14435 [Streptomyces sp. MN03-5084-2B]|nr:hypothetical protein [Streptomyces sp. MN03-5084-2B]